MSRMKRVPGRARASARLQSVGRASARTASIETPSKRLASSACLARAISERTPPGSSIARLDEALEDLDRAAGIERIARKRCTFAQVRRLSCGHQQSGGVEDDDILLGPACLAGEQRL